MLLPSKVHGGLSCVHFPPETKFLKTKCIVGIFTRKILPPVVLCDSLMWCHVTHVVSCDSLM